MKYYLPAILLLILSATSHGEEFGIRRGANKELILTGKSCANLLKQRTALCDWKKQAEPAFIQKKDPYSCTVSKGQGHTSDLKLPSEFC